MSDRPPADDRVHSPDAVPQQSGTDHGETGRQVEEIREVVFGPDGRTPRVERWIRRTRIERDPKAGLVRSALGAVFAFALQVVLAMVALAVSLRVLATEPGWVAAVVAAGSVGAVFGLPLFIDHAPEEAKKVTGTLVFLLGFVVSVLYLGTVWFGLAGGLGAAVLAVTFVLWLL